MATAVAKVQSKTVEKEVREKVVKVELTDLEAKVLTYTLASIGGNRLTSYRRETERIFRALRSAGVEWDFGKRYMDGSLSAAALKAEDA